MSKAVHVTYAAMVEADGTCTGATPCCSRRRALRLRRLSGWPTRPQEPAWPAGPADSRDALDAFQRAADTGTIQGLLDILAPDVVFLGDGGGIKQAVPRPIVGADKVGRLRR